ncbi:MAG TPA: phospho-N-acetylmuramoyl-pentapeptide-transferase [Peptococcaceae bacterium]|jgi:phospho-N-acetylmuramoyl-pentapeptide-transferase|nr:phospho-N-acetylmuramoyl-pentapeptide-transferase [Clostridia bacterium]HOB81814.1 phospho-N-acetylmuramoyl-pentapeptide-transferase [Peptococcaceae bacterium]HPZ72009.1 phospho-N-acetylmuramoyl-pentapeptide-transferase [Peptococcaceae bacterium]HQD53720.1 phospho-N-acetylmuramoyl-pentapeptide-transferase [Peptococcaceae bacterium]
MQNYHVALVLAILVYLISGPLLIPFLHKLKFGQQIREDGPKEHLKKAGTPTMGGIMFLFSLAVCLFFREELSSRLVVLLLVTFGFGLIGFFDDFIKVVMKRSLGLKAREKILGQLILAAVFTYVAVVFLDRGTGLILPGTAFKMELGWLYYPFAVFLMVGTVNAVNLTDGLDGLLAGVMVFTALVFLLLAHGWGLTDVRLFAAALLGSCLGFLFFNLHPARIFMGDTGSLALGGAVGALAVLTKMELLLPLLGGVYVLNTLAVILQVVYFRLTGGRRLFLMSPLHHHFELLGWSEQKVVWLFWTAAALFAVLTVIIVL